MTHQAMDEETSKFMAAKDINTTKYANIKRHIETRYLEELGRKAGTKNATVSALEEGEQEQWYSEGDANDLSALKGGKKGWGKGKSEGKGPSATGAMGTGTWSANAPRQKEVMPNTSALYAAGAGTLPATTRTCPKARARETDGRLRAKERPARTGTRDIHLRPKDFAGTRGIQPKGTASTVRAKGRTKGNAP